MFSDFIHDYVTHDVFFINLFIYGYVDVRLRAETVRFFSVILPTLPHWNEEEEKKKMNCSFIVAFIRLRKNSELYS